MEEVKLLVQLLGSSSGDMQEHAAAALSKLSGSPAHCQSIGTDRTVLVVLVRGLGSGSAGAREHCVRALANLSIDHGPAIAEVGGVPALMGQLTSSNATVRQAAAQALCNVESNNGPAPSAPPATPHIPAEPKQAPVVSRVGGSGGGQW